MEDTRLYEHLLGLKSPWSVGKVELNTAQERVDLYAEHDKRTEFSCPECDKPSPIHDHAESRCWRHLDSCQFATYLHARVPRVRCKEHGVRQVRVSWSEPRSRFTLLFERFAIDVLRQTTITGARQILRLSWDEAWGLMDRAVRRGQARKLSRVVRHMGVDEKSVAKGHRYLTVVYYLDNKTVEGLEEGRSQSSLGQYFEGLSEEQRQGVEVVTMDMWDAFIAATKKYIPEAEGKIVFDRFHIMKKMNEAVDQVRRKENKELCAQGIELLKRTRYTWLRNEEDLTVDARYFAENVRKACLKTGRAWAIKEFLRGLWNQGSEAAAKTYWERWDSWASHCKMAPVVAVAKMVRRHLDNILTYFRHWLTNAVAEAVNSVIQTVKRGARGFRNIAHFKTAIFFHCGGLNLYPDCP